MPVEEKHITVIKRAPALAPEIELISERDEDLTYTGVMRITEPFTGNAASNLSSFALALPNELINRFNFSGLKVGDSFKTAIETNILGESDFTLEWQVGDTVLFKEFDNNNTAPAVPITNYRIKAKVLPLFDSSANVQQRFTDSARELVENGSFLTPNQSGTEPLNFTIDPAVVALLWDWNYNNALSRIEIDQPDDGVTAPYSGQWRRIEYTGPPIVWDTSGATTYAVTANVSGYVSGSFSIYLVSDVVNVALNLGTNYFYKVSVQSDGQTVQNVVFDPANAFNAGASGNTANFNSQANGFLIQTNSTGFVGNIDSISIVNLDADNARINFKITDIIGSIPTVDPGDVELKFAVDRLETEDKLYEFKLPRFATRYRYQDGEYSPFSPFTQVAFLPGAFDFHPKKGYNIGMTNRLTSLKVNLNTDVFPAGVVAVDILYKEDGTTNVYVLDSVKKQNWNNDYIVNSEAVNRSVPSNQLIRPWDNVPKRALAQDVTGSRIVYANYKQGYDLVDVSDNDYYPKITTDFESSLISTKTETSIKSLRDYQVGVVFVDKYGRETPVIANQDGSTLSGSKLTKENADKANKIKVTLNQNTFMKDAEFFKFFVKETSGEYYNLAMDRFWDAEDDHIWVSFASSDINKIVLDDFLILKKGVNVNYLVKDTARYKIIAIENEAPDYIKTKKALIESKQHDSEFPDTDIFGDILTNESPLSGRDAFDLKYTPFVGSSGGGLDKIDDGSVLYIEFTTSLNTGVSKRYRINSVDTNFRHHLSIPATDTTYNIKLDKKLGEDVDFISDGTKIIDTTIVNIYKYKVENSPEFDGRFFVKLLNDDVFQTNVSTKSLAVNYRVAVSKKLYYLKSDIATTHAGSITGQTDGMYGADGGDFGRYAAFFRNYKHATGIQQISHSNSSIPNFDVGQYRFGVSDHWEKEFLDYTSSGTSAGGNGTAGYVGAWSPNNTNANRDDSNLKQADLYDSSGEYLKNFEPGDEEVWFIDQGLFTGAKTDNFSIHWTYMNQGNGTSTGISNFTSSSTQATLQLAVGGIYHDKVCEPGDVTISGFFNVGTGNDYHNEPDTVNLVSNLNTAKSFRFKDDPKQTVYTIQSYANKRLLRYNDGTPGDETSPSTQYPWDNVDDQISQLAPNFTRGWSLNIKNQDGDGEMKWVPTGSPGPIIGDGLVLTVVHSSTLAGAAAPGLAVRVPTLLAEHTDGSKHPIKEGMILTSHSNGSSGNVLDGGTDKEFLIIWKIEASGTEHIISLTGYSTPLTTSHDLFTNAPPTVDQNLVFKQAKMNGYSNFSANRINAQDAAGQGYSVAQPRIYALGYSMEFLESIDEDSELPTNPAIFETEPKENTPLEIYYEASGLNPIRLKEETKHLAIPTGSLVEHVGNPNSIAVGATINSVEFDGPLNSNQPVDSGWAINVIDRTLNPFVNNNNIVASSLLKITRPDGSAITVKVTGFDANPGGLTANKIYIAEYLYTDNAEYTLNWYNCFSFGNGVESNRIKDNYNLPYMANGVKVSTVLEDEEDYQEEHRKYGLIYSGIYNGIGSVNSLNQFIAGEKTTKEINPVYGSIQKLYSRDSDLIALCENKVLQIYANKDALFNADGNVNLTATNKVLGQVRPFTGEYGISKNPESFASESYRAYFTDKVRGAVLRLSKDGLTPISAAGMKDYFKDNLKENNKLIGSYDDRKNEYNITLPTTNTTVSYKEDVRGWVSFKSFVPENGVSCSNNYYTLKEGELYKHHDASVDRNTFYDSFVNSSLEVVLNEGPEFVKTFRTLSYEGSQGKIQGITTQDDIEVSAGQTAASDYDLYNAVIKDGWFVSSIETDKHIGSLNEFIDKENKWFNYIRRNDGAVENDNGYFENIDFGSNLIKGIGEVESVVDVSSFRIDINFEEDQTGNVSIGDVLYASTVNLLNADANNTVGYATLDLQTIIKIGEVIGVNTNQVELKDNSGVVTAGTYIFSVKNHTIESAGMLGYYASVKFENDSKEKAEMFSVGSEITPSSK